MVIFEGFTQIVWVPWVSQALREALEDAQAGVRTAARNCFWAFEGKFQDQKLRVVLEFMSIERYSHGNPSHLHYLIY